MKQRERKIINALYTEEEEYHKMSMAAGTEKRKG